MRRGWRWSWRTSPPCRPRLSTGEGELKGESFAPGQRYLRGLFSGGTLAYEAQYILQDYLPHVWANAPLNKEDRIPNSLISQEHTIIDLGEDEFTVGRLHPMMDNELRIRRLDQEAADPEIAVILLDVVLGYGSHPDPASELAPAIARAKSRSPGGRSPPGNRRRSHGHGRGSAELGQPDRAAESRGRVGRHEQRGDGALCRPAGARPQSSNPESAVSRSAVPVDLATLQKPLSAINVGLESFAENLIAQGAQAIQVDWRPPAGGNEKLMAILERMKEASRLSSLKGKA